MNYDLRYGSRRHLHLRIPDEALIVVSILLGAARRILLGPAHPHISPQRTIRSVHLRAPSPLLSSNQGKFVRGVPTLLNAAIGETLRCHWYWFAAFQSTSTCIVLSREEIYAQIGDIRALIQGTPEVTFNLGRRLADRCVERESEHSDRNQKVELERL